MKPCPFAWERPDSLEALLKRLADGPDQIKLLAGGQSLGPMLNLRLVEPALILDLTGIAELRQARIEDGSLVLGACVTHADIEDGRVPDVTGGALRRVAAAIAYRPVRNRGTVGGSLVHADPAADWVSALTALDATVEIASRKGRRMVPVGQFVTGALEVALEPEEVLVSIRVPALLPDAAWGYVKTCTKVGEFAHAIGAVRIQADRGRGRAVIGALEGAPVVLADARPLFGGRIGPDFGDRFDPEAVAAVLQAAGVTDAVERHIHTTVLARAVAQAARSAPKLQPVDRPEAA